jgi:hypothetical protein
MLIYDALLKLGFVACDILANFKTVGTGPFLIILAKLCYSSTEFLSFIKVCSGTSEIFRSSEICF